MTATLIALLVGSTGILMAASLLLLMTHWAEMGEVSGWEDES